jgi:hypothetical protein
MVKISSFNSKYAPIPANNEAHLRGQFLVEEHTLNVEMFLIYRAGTQRPTVYKRRAEFRAKT